jgi:Bacterial regulatory helix-turn-helix protein, lysR family
VAVTEEPTSAGHLGITQPALSHAIGRLGRRLGMPLLEDEPERLAHHSRVVPAGPVPDREIMPAGGPAAAVLLLRAALAACPGLTRAAESSAHPRRLRS